MRLARKRWIALWLSLVSLTSAVLAQEDFSGGLAARDDVDRAREQFRTSIAASDPAAGGGTCGCESNCGCQPCYQPCGTCGCFEPYCHSSGWWASAEVIWFKYHRADGAREGVLDNEVTEFDLETTPRITIGWVGTDGLGLRARYWEFDHCAPARGTDPPPPVIVDEEGFSLCVDTYTLDVEVFDTFCLNRNWDLELAAGIRYNEFLEAMDDNDLGVVEDRFNDFSGFGIVTSAELRRAIGTSGIVWARARGSILMDDKDVFNEDGARQQVRLIDVTVGTTELAFGYDYVMPIDCGSYWYLRLQAEWQTWYNYSSSFVDTAANEDFGGPSDVGFAGVGIGAGIAR